MLIMLTKLMLLMFAINYANYVDNLPWTSFDKIWFKCY